MLPTILTGAAGRALKTLAPLEGVAMGSKSDARMLIEVARGDVHRALGEQAGRRAIAELHPAAQNVANGVETFSHDVLARHRGSLEAVASSTARTRIIVGSLAVGGAVAGLAALMGDDEPNGRIMAPGPLGQQPTPPTTA